MKFLPLILTGIAGCVLCEQCHLPKPQENFDWTKFNGEWFENAFASTAYDKAFRCKVIHSYPDVDVTTLTLYDVYHPDKPVVVKLDIMDDGHYQIPRNSGEDLEKYDQKLDEETSQSSNTIAEGRQDIEGFTSHKQTLLSFDNDQYFLAFGCGKNGEKFIWFVSRNRYPDAKGIALLHNTLAGLGNGWGEVQIRLSDCPAVL